MASVPPALHCVFSGLGWGFVDVAAEDSAVIWGFASLRVPFKALYRDIDTRKVSRGFQVALLPVTSSGAFFFFLSLKFVFTWLQLEPEHDNVLI